MSNGERPNGGAPDITWELGDDHVGVITLNRPEARNALTHGMYAELEHRV